MPKITVAIFEHHTVVSPVAVGSYHSRDKQSVELLLQGVQY